MAAALQINPYYGKVLKIPPFPAHFRYLPSAWGAAAIAMLGQRCVKTETNPFAHFFLPPPLSLGRTSFTGLATHFKAVLDEGPGMLYNVPGRTGQDIPDDVVLALKDHPNFIGVKECTGNDRIAAYARAGVKCWSGNDDEAHAARHDAAAAGVVSVASNLCPAAFSKLMDARDDAAAAALAPLVDWLFCEPNPIAVNTALAMCGLVAPVFRLPYVPLSKAQREAGVTLLKDAAPYLTGVDPGRIRAMDDDEFKLVRGG